MLIACLLFLAGAAAVSAAAAGPVLRRAASARSFESARQGLFAVSSVSEDVAYRKIKGMTVGDSESLTVGSTTASASVSMVSGKLAINGSAAGGNFARAARLFLAHGAGASFNYGMQAGAGGIELDNSSSIDGNVQSDGPVTGAGGNLIKGTVVSAGAQGHIESIHATSSAYAHTIEDSTIDGDAYYQTISRTTVGGALHAGSADQATSSLAISDAQITQWENDAAAGGTISSPCPYQISDTITIGPTKITCDVEISGTGYTVTLAGPVWVAGNVTIKNSPTIKVASSVGSASVALIADNPGNRTTSSKISSDNSASFEGSGSAGSYVLLLSQNRSAADGGSDAAITFANSAQGALLSYAGHGEIRLQNSVSLKEVSAYKIRLQNNSEVVYETGIANLLFTSGPSGGYTIDSWKETE